MSATAFQRRRREIAKQGDSVKQQDKTDFSKLKNEDLKAKLDDKGVKYDARANKETLIKLLEGAE